MGTGRAMIIERQKEALVADRLSIGDLAAKVNRRPHTIRQWERENLLPVKLVPRRDDRGRRYWTEHQAEEILLWMVRKDMRPGKGLKHYKPTPEQLNRHLERQRRPRAVKKVEGEAAA